MEEKEMKELLQQQFLLLSEKSQQLTFDEHILAIQQMIEIYKLFRKISF